jgi:hypothetical protein
MKPLHISYILILFLLLPSGSFSQPAPQPATAATSKTATTDTARRTVADTAKASAVANPDDDEFNVFLFTFAIGFVAVIAGASLFGTIAFALVLLALFGLISAGILSTGLLVGIRKKSVAAGFKTVFIIFCCLVATLAGSAGLALVNYLFHLNWRPTTAAMIGASAGLLGGLLLGFILLFFLRIFLQYCQRKWSA